MKQGLVQKENFERQEAKCNKEHSQNKSKAKGSKIIRIYKMMSIVRVF